MDSRAITGQTIPLITFHGAVAPAVCDNPAGKIGDQSAFARSQPRCTLDGIYAQIELVRDEFEEPRPAAVAPPSGPRWYLRALAVVAVIGVYAFYRELRVGAGRDVFDRGLPVEPFRHALTVLKVEHALWLDIEQGLQDIFISSDWIIRFSNGYYSWAHQVMTLGLVVAVLMRAPWRDARRWVGALALQLPVGLVLFRLYPLMPPRLLDVGAPWGGRILQTHRGLRPTGIVDTLAQFKGPWTPPPIALNGFTNQYAAMPSLHCAFAMWAGIVWWQWAKGKKWRVVGPLHVAFTFFCVVVTGNHFVPDAVAGWSIAILMLAITGRFIWLKRFVEAVRSGSYPASGAADDDSTVLAPDDYESQTDSSRMPSTTATSQ